MTHIVIDPVTRIEGHLRIEAEVDGGVVRNAWSSATMFRGVEIILKGRDPRDAWAFTQRICGVCTTVHSIASIRAVENAIGALPPPNARLLRNLIMASQMVQDHVVHFYHLHALDWVDIVSALSADPAATSRLAQSISDWPLSSASYFRTVKERVQQFVERGQLGPFANAYWGHPAYHLPAEANLLAVAHYLEALDWQRDFIKMHAVLGGKNPHLQSFLVGGMATPIDPDKQASINMTSISTMQKLVREARNFVEKVYIPDLLAVASFYKEWAGYGAGVGNYLAYGEYPETEGANAPLFLPRGIIRDRDLSTVDPFDPAQVTEYVTHSWFEYEGGDEQGLHPSQGETKPTYTGPEPPYDRLDTDGKYSWLKSPRYDGKPLACWWRTAPDTRG
jgi:Ni,Fe-hydrogenase I large subunit